ncbi:MAG: outer membrane protein assembly factor BamB [Spongiibacteraceae bacterium]|jgi:outer membrane protein assembly factor BamB|nr:outer membrane protein assembly factor BamB [Spongiibacteraceae bacterium]
MPMLRRLGWLLLCTGLLFSAGCSWFGDEEENAPAPLPEFKAERSLERVWRRGVGNGQGKIYNRLVPAVYGDTIYAAGANGDVRALRLKNGKVRWDAEIDEGLSGGVGVDQERVYLGANDGVVVALDRADGKPLWRARMSGEVLAPPVSDGRVVAVQTFDGKLTGLDAATGEQLWTFGVTVPVLTLRGTSTPLLVDDMVLAGFANGKVMAVDLATGSLRWERRVGLGQGSTEIERLSDIDSELLLRDGVVYAVSYQGRVTAIEARSGRQLWSREASSHVGLAEGFDNVYVATSGGSVIAFARNGQGVRWEQTALSRRRLSGLAAWSSYVAVGDFEGYLHLLSQVDGHFVARVKVDGDGLRVPPLLVDDTLYVFGNGGTLAAYRLKTE